MPEYLFPLKDRKEVAEETMAFWLDTSGSDFAFKAGQHVDMTLIDPPYTDTEGTMRTYSIASSPQDKRYIMSATRMRNTAFKNSLKEIPLGTKIKVVGPMGSFTLHQDVTKPAVFLAGGIGITPFRGIVEYATGALLFHKITLFYSNRTMAATAFLEDFEKWEQKNPYFKFVGTITDEQNPNWKHEYGRIDVAMIRKYVSDIPNAIFYVAGPPAMVAGMRQLLTSLKVSDDNIKTEEFSGY